MKRCVLLLFFFLLASPAFAQNLTTVTASNIIDVSGAKLASGALCFDASNATNSSSDTPGSEISFQAGGGGQVLRGPICTPITTGAIGSFQVPNSANTVPAGVVYHIYVIQGSYHLLDYYQVSVTGTTWSFDTYNPNTPVGAVPSGASVNGPLTVNGDLAVTGSFTPGTLGNTSISGTLAVTGNGDAGNVAIKAASGDAVMYVSPDGSDTNDGLSWGTAKATVGAAASALSSGGIIHVAGMETVTSGVTISTAGIKILCEKGAGFTINGTGVALSFEGSRQTVEGCTFSGTTNNAPIFANADRFHFIGNTLSGFSTTDSGNGTLKIISGDGDLVSGNTFSSNVNNDIVVTTGTAGGGSGTVSNLRIVNNYASEIVLHTTAAGTNLQHVVVANNSLTNGESSKVEFCVEIGAFGGNTPQDIVVAHNTCTVQANAVDGGYSLGGQRVVETGNVFDGNGFTVNVAAYEVEHCTDCSVTGNTAYDSTSQGVTFNHAVDSALTGNVIDGFGTGSNKAGIWVGVTDTITPNASGNTISGNTIIFPTGGAGIGIWQQCDATGATCENNAYIGNTIISDGTSSSRGISIENDTGTTTGISVARNSIRGPATAFGGASAGALVSSDLPAPFADYAACGASLEGNIAAITDSTTVTFDATITGSGSDHIQGRCNGTNWAVQ